MTSERQLLLDAVGMALVFMHLADPALAGRYLDRLVEDDFITAEQAMTLMDTLRARVPASTDERNA